MKLLREIVKKTVQILPEEKNQKKNVLAREFNLSDYVVKV